MTKIRTRFVRIGSVAAATVLGMAALAWACTVQVQIVQVAPQAPLPGSSAVLSGEGIAPGTPVVIRWNDPAGQVLGETVAQPGGTYALAVQVPAVAPGVYYFVVSAGNAGTARAAVEVLGAQGATTTTSGPASASGDVWSGFAAGETPSAAPQVNGTSDSSGSLGTGAAILAAGIVALAAAVAGGLSRPKAFRGRGPRNPVSTSKIQ